jgi:hypothetical protein
MGGVQTILGQLGDAADCELPQAAPSVDAWPDAQRVGVVSGLVR